MKEKIKEKGFIQTPLLVGIIISVVVAPAGIGAVLRLASLQYPWIKNVEIYLNGEEMESVHGGKG